MKELTALEKDALVEICNVGMSKAGKQLSALLNAKVDISIPDMELNASDTYKKAVSSGEVLSFVLQNSSDDLVGRCLLIFRKSETENLTKRLVFDTPQFEDYQADALLEIGNIIISSCMSSIVNMLDIKSILTTPEYSEVKEKLEQLDELFLESEEKKDLFVFKTNLNTIKDTISGSLVLLLPEKSIDVLLERIAAMLGDI